MAKYKKEDGCLSEDLLQLSLHHYEAAKTLLNNSPGSYDSGGYS